MTLEKHILRDLHTSQASAAALADTLGKPLPVIQIILTRLLAQGKLTTSKIAGTITVYHLV